MDRLVIEDLDDSAVEVRLERPMAMGIGRASADVSISGSREDDLFLNNFRRVDASGTTVTEDEPGPSAGRVISSAESRERKLSRL